MDKSIASFRILNSGVGSLGKKLFKYKLNVIPLNAWMSNRMNNRGAFVSLYSVRRLFVESVRIRALLKQVSEKSRVCSKDSVPFRQLT